MKHIFIIILLLTGMPRMNATETKKSITKVPMELDEKVPMAPLDTIWANEKMNLALFFPSEIRQGIVGSEDFAFTYNREKGQTLGLLKAVEGEPSNLLVITVEGNVYSYIIGYSEELSKLNRFVTRDESIGNEVGGFNKERKAVQMDSTDQEYEVPKTFVSEEKDLETRVNNDNTKNTEEFILKSCASLLKGPERFKRFKRKKGLSLGISNMVYYDDLIFVQYQFGNKSGIDFDIRSLELVKVQGNNRRKSSYQEHFLSAVHTYGMPEKVRYGYSARFVRVYHKMTLGDGERFEVRLKEDMGSRKIRLKNIR